MIIYIFHPAKKWKRFWTKPLKLNGLKNRARQHEAILAKRKAKGVEKLTLQKETTTRVTKISWIEEIQPKHIGESRTFLVCWLLELVTDANSGVWRIFVILEAQKRQVTSQELKNNHKSKYSERK